MFFEASIYCGSDQLQVCSIFCMLNGFCGRHCHMFVSMCRKSTIIEWVRYSVFWSSHYKNNVFICALISCKTVAHLYMLYMDLWKRFVIGLDHMQVNFWSQASKFLSYATIMIDEWSWVEFTKQREMNFMVCVICTFRNNLFWATQM